MPIILNRFRQQTKTEITRKFIINRIINRFPSSVVYSTSEHENSHSESGIHFENHRIEDVNFVY